MYLVFFFCSVPQWLATVGNPCLLSTSHIRKLICPVLAISKQHILPVCLFVVQIKLHPLDFMVFTMEWSFSDSFEPQPCTSLLNLPTYSRMRNLSNLSTMMFCSISSWLILSLYRIPDGFPLLSWELFRPPCTCFGCQRSLFFKLFEPSSYSYQGNMQLFTNNLQGMIFLKAFYSNFSSFLTILGHTDWISIELGNRVFWVYFTREWKNNKLCNLYIKWNDILIKLYMHNI
jgi:hypothetical protein